MSKEPYRAIRIFNGALIVYWWHVWEMHGEGTYALVLCVLTVIIFIGQTANLRDWSENDDT